MLEALPRRLLLVLLFTPASSAWAGLTLSLAQAPGGVPITAGFHTGFGNVNGLGVGVPGAGLTVLGAGVTGGVVYTTPYNLVIAGLSGTDTGTVTVFVRSNFANLAILILQSCQHGANCSSASNFAAISLSSSTPTTVIGSPGVPNGTYTAFLGLFVSNTNGAAAFTGTDTARLRFVVTESTTGSQSRADLALDTPSENVQTAVQLLLATAPAGLTISAAADYAANFGNVNGLGIGGPAAGLTVRASSGGVIYSTPYLIQPSFSSFSSTTASVKVYVSSDFVHPSALQLRDAAASGGPFTDISKSSGSQTSLTSSAASGSSMTRFLGLFVSSANGAGAFPGTSGGSGTDSATLTFTLTVP